MIYLAQKRPGDWFLFHRPFTGEPEFHPIPVPSWAVERHTDELEDFASLLAGMFGNGRKQGKAEGIESAQSKMRESIGVIE